MSQLLEKDRQAQWKQRAEQGAAPRQQVSWWCISRMAKHLPPEDVWLANWLMEMRRKMGSAAVSDTCERVQCSTADYGLRMSKRIKDYAGYQGAVLMSLGQPGYACLDGITSPKVLTRPALAARVNYSPNSKQSLIRLVQMTMEVAQAYHQENAQTRAA